MTVAGLLGLAAAGARGGNVVYSNDSDPHPIALAGAGDLVPDGTGFVAVGSFTLGEAALAAASDSAANYAAVAADFIAFGTGSTFGVAGQGGMFSAASTAPLPAGSSLEGLPIFLVAGNGADLASSNQLWMFRSGETFGADGGDAFSARIELDAEFPAGQLLVGEPVPLALPGAGGVFDGSRMVAIIPEPGAGALLACGLVGAALRRRRR